MPDFAVWVIYIMIGGVGYPANDDAKFSNETACRIYLRMKYSKVQEIAPVHCTNVGPLICQGKPCS
jgi:hypothetical protein